jgi:hypothetical protein
LKLVQNLSCFQLYFIDFIQGKLESHREYERITKQVEVDMARENPELDEEISSWDLDLEEKESSSLTRAFLEERDRLKDQKSNEEQFFR